MVADSRTSKSIKNIIISIICQILMTLIGFISRKVFLIFLDAEYLGLNGLFSSVLTVLSLAELGIGPAMIFSLYRPLADGDIQVCRSLMRIYRKTYAAIGVIILIVGGILSPFVKNLISEVPEQINRLEIIFLLFVVETSISYLFSYKRSIITASQFHYKIDAVHTAAYFLRNCLQILVLVFFRNYYVFLVVQIGSTVLENITLSLWVDKYFPWLSLNKPVNELPKKVRIEIVRNVKAMVFHKIGGIVIDTIDNFLISKFFGLLFLGFYSNYLLVINAVHKLTASFFTAISASIGDFGARKNKEDSYRLYKKISFLNFWMAAFCTVCVFVLLPPFIQLWLGEKFVISQNIFVVIAINFYITCMRRTNLVFKESYGFPWADRYKPLVAAVVNLWISILLATKYGVIGVLIGTTITQLTVVVWVEAYVVYKNIFQMQITDFLKKYLYMAIITCGLCLITDLICSLLPMYIWIGFIIACTICVLLPNIIIIVLYRKTDEFVYIVSIIKNRVLKVKSVV